MRRQLYLTVAVLLSATGTAFADMGTPGFSRVPHDFVFEVESEAPGYRFWLVSARGVEPLDLAPGRPFRVDGEGRNGSHRLATVIVAPAGLVEEAGEAQFLEAFQAGKIQPGVVRAGNLDFLGSVPFFDSRDRIVEHYRVEFTPASPPRLVPLGEEPGNPWVRGAWVAAGIFTAAAVVCGVLWLLRKTAKKQPLA